LIGGCKAQNHGPRAGFAQARKMLAQPARALALDLGERRVAYQRSAISGQEKVD
jgi:hypothetical protein